MCNCNRNNNYDLAGLDEEDYKLFGGGVAGYIGTSFLNHWVSTNKDGTPKNNYFAANEKVRQAAYMAGGAAAGYYSDGNNLVKGAGMGAFIFGAKELIRGFTPNLGISGMAAAPAPAAVTGHSYSNQQQIAGNNKNGNPKYIEGFYPDLLPPRRRSSPPIATATPTAAAAEKGSFNQNYMY